MTDEQDRQDEANVAQLDINRLVLRLRKPKSGKVTISAKTARSLAWILENSKFTARY